MPKKLSVMPVSEKLGRARTRYADLERTRYEIYLTAEYPQQEGSQADGDRHRVEHLDKVLAELAKEIESLEKEQEKQDAKADR